VLTPPAKQWDLNDKGNELIASPLYKHVIDKVISMQLPCTVLAVCQVRFRSRGHLVAGRLHVNSSLGQSRFHPDKKGSLEDAVVVQNGDAGTWWNMGIITSAGPGRPNLLKTMTTHRVHL